MSADQRTGRGLADLGTLVLARCDKVRPIRAQLNVGDLAKMTLVGRLQFLARLRIVLCNLARLVAGDDDVGEGGKEGDGSFGAERRDVDFVDGSVGFCRWSDHGIATRTEKDEC